MWHSRVASETGGMCWYTKISSLASACRRWSTVLKFAGKLCPAMLAAGAVEQGWPRRYFFFGGKSLSLQRARFVSLTAPVVAIALARDHGCRKLLLLAFWLVLACVGFAFWLLLAFRSVGLLAPFAFGFCWLFGSGHSAYRRMTRNYIEMLAFGLRWLQVILASFLVAVVAVVVLLVVVVLVVGAAGAACPGGGAAPSPQPS